MGRHAYRWHEVHRQHYALSFVDEDDAEDQEPETTTPLPGKMEEPPASEMTTTPIPGESPDDLMPPAPKCNVNSVPNCPLLNDAISTMVGELRDTFVREKTAYETQLQDCNKVSAEYEAQIKDWEGIHDQAEVTLAQAITQIDTNQAEMEAKEIEYADLEKQFNAKMEECVTKRNAIMDTMCGDQDCSPRALQARAAGGFLRGLRGWRMGAAGLLGVVRWRNASSDPRGACRAELGCGMP